MDYHVLVLSRIREAIDNGMTTERAIRYGVARTAGVVTNAALVMVAVFSIFGTLSSLAVKQAGVGLAAAVLIDATIIRAILLPAAMTLLGEHNWYLPHWLHWLPRTDLDANHRTTRRQPRLHEPPNSDAQRLRLGGSGNAAGESRFV
jgi:putative drug exporter of the RND superfamily